MVFFVVVFNLSIALVNIYLAVKILQLRRRLRRTTNTLIKCEKRIYFVLAPAPQVILRGKENIYHFNQRYQILHLQLQKIRQILLLLSSIYRLTLRF